MLDCFTKLIEVVELREYQNPTYEHRKVAVVRTREATYQLEYSYNQIVRIMVSGTYPIREIFKMYEDMEYIRIK